MDPASSSELRNKVQRRRHQYKQSSSSKPLPLDKTVKTGMTVI
jgi:hypothetical protein